MDKGRLTKKTIGILALQGDYEAHRSAIADRMGLAAVLVRTPLHLDSVDALVIPGGESTAIAKLLNRVGLDDRIRDRVQQGMPVFGTCAGMILMGDRIDERPDQPTLKLLDIVTKRNAFGRQVDSFEADIPFQDGEAESRSVRGVFIRAPFVLHAGAGVEILATFQDRIVAVRKDGLLATAFHPELTDDLQVHTIFAEMVESSSENR